MRLQWTRNAISDRRIIVIYIAREDPTAAIRMNTLAIFSDSASDAGTT